MLSFLYFLLATQGVSARIIESVPVPRDTAERVDRQLTEHLVHKPDDCCYGNSTVPHGTVVNTVPEACMQDVCIHGLIQPIFVNSPTDKGCIQFGENLYPEGSELPGHCIKIIAKNGEWVPGSVIDDCCVPCHLINDPHITTFDNYQYDWHGTCNYSLAQSDLTFNPDVGVFSDFVPCGQASCLHCSTFRDNPNTIISFCTDNIYYGTVNGEAFNVPTTGILHLLSVLAFRDGSCVMFVGSSGLVVRHCSYRLDIFAHPTHFDQLDGLCGHYNKYVQDDFTSRSDVLYPLQYYPVVFPLSWKTNEQENRACNVPCPEKHVCENEEGTRLTDGTTSPCKAKAEGSDVYAKDYELCANELKETIGGQKNFKRRIENCADDVCVWRERGANDDKILELKREIIQLNCEERQIEDAMKGQESITDNCAKLAQAAVITTTK